jgi:hypothetical protein
MRLGRPFKTRFRYGSTYNGLTSPHNVTRRPIMQKVRSHPAPEGAKLELLISVRFQVLFHSPNRGSFHLSLTVLVHYR